MTGDAQFDHVAERASIVEALLSGTADLAGDIAMHELLVRFTDLLAAASEHLRLAWFYLGDPDAEYIRPAYAAGPQIAHARSLVVDRSKLMMKGPVRRALTQGEPVIQQIPERLNPVAQLLPGVRAWHRKAVNANVGAVLALPFPLRGRNEWGLSVIYVDRADYFEKVGVAPFTAFARLARIGLRRAELRQRELENEARIAHLSMYDALTGLPNRVLFHDYLNSAIERAQDGQDRLALVILDLDHFKDINAHFGLAAGDGVLKEIGSRLHRAFFRDAVIAHLGSDEFALMPYECSGERSLAELLDRCLGVVAAEIELHSHRLSVSASGGVTVCTPVEGCASADDLMRRANAALSRAKREGRACWHLFEEAPEERATRGRHLLIGDVKAALGDNQFYFLYQPQVRIDPAGRPPVAGVEALLRWRHPVRGTVTPADFIHAVEQSALIRDLGRRVLHEALSAVDRWQREGLHFTLGVNIGARHLLHPDFIKDVQDALARYPFPYRLEIEITESAALADLHRARRALAECRALGVGVALDDFGSGHASLTYLEQLPVTRLKIDQRFVRELLTQPKDLAIIAGTVVSARLLGLEVVAEGVETARHGSVLARIGCDLVQGFAVAKPMPPRAVPGWVRRWRPVAEWQHGAARLHPQALPLLTAQVSHRRQAALMLSALDAEVPDYTGLRLHIERIGDCSFERWYADDGLALFGSVPEFREIAPLHRRFHALGDALLHCLDHGERKDVERLRTQLEACADALLAQLRLVQDRLVDAASMPVTPPLSR